MYVVIGLGNPGAKYATTRHNIGWLVLDSLAGKKKWQADVKAKAEYCELSDTVLLIKPQTFMNASGTTVVYIKKRLAKLPLSHFIVVHDDKDISFGVVKITDSSRSAGHNGVQSIIDSLGSQDFPRIRVGVKNEQLLKTMPTDKFVLAKFTPEEQKQLPGVMQKAVQEVSIRMS